MGNRSIDDQLEELRSQVDKLKSLSSNLSICNSTILQDKIIKDLLYDAIQLGEGAFLVGNARLGTPLFALMRIICELMFRIDWVSLSPDNAIEFESEVCSGMEKTVAVYLKRGRATIVNGTTGEDYTDKILPQIRTSKQPGKIIENLAKDLGLSKVYDIVYRFSSLEVHIKTFGMSPSDEEALLAGLASIVSLIKVISLITENKVLRNQKTAADEILKVLRINNVGGE